MFRQKGSRWADMLRQKGQRYADVWSDNKVPPGQTCSDKKVSAGQTYAWSNNKVPARQTCSDKKVSAGQTYCPTIRIPLGRHAPTNSCQRWADMVRHKVPARARQTAPTKRSALGRRMVRQ